MKKSILLLATCLMLAVTAKAQIFDIDGESGSDLRESALSAPETPGFGGESDSGPYSPVGGGAALLIGFGAAYMMAKKRKR